MLENLTKIFGIPDLPKRGKFFTICKFGSNFPCRLKLKARQGTGY